jgi:arylsulfatase A-like enzyme
MLKDELGNHKLRAALHLTSELSPKKMTRRTVLNRFGMMVGGLSVLALDSVDDKSLAAVIPASKSQPIATLTGAVRPSVAESALLEGAKPEQVSAVKKPNIVVFFTDQQRWDTTGASGNQLGLTPNFDRMAARGTYLQNFSTCQPVCGPARSCLQTGLFATQTGVWRNGPALDPEYPDTLAKIFSKNGYDTGYIGKWHLGASDGPVPKENRGGYDYWWASEALEITTEAYGGTVWDKHLNPIPITSYRSDALTDNAVQYINKHYSNKKPFLLVVSYIEPHQQNNRDDYPAPDVYRETYKGKWTPPDLAALPSTVESDPDCAQRCLPGYLGMIKRVDEGLGRIQDTLKSLGLDQNTVVVYTADHGNHFKTRNREYKRSCHEASIRLPGAIQGPGFDGVGTITNLVSLIDLAPTILDAAHLPIPSQMQGKALGAHIRGEIKAWPDDIYIQISESQTGRAVRTDKWKYGVDSVPNRTSTPTAEMYVEQYLYDLEKDPYELNNLVGQAQYEDVAIDLQNRLKRWMKQAGEPDATISRAMPLPGGD